MALQQIERQLDVNYISVLFVLFLTKYDPYFPFGSWPDINLYYIIIRNVVIQKNRKEINCSFLTDLIV